MKAADLESALLMLPFNDALRLLTYMPAWLVDGASQVRTGVVVPAFSLLACAPATAKGIRMKQREHVPLVRLT